MISGFSEGLATFATTFGLISLAEMGDKSQIVCMTLAARHRAIPVFLGAILAFAFLSLTAVVFGASVGNWFPEQVVALIVAVLFALFGIYMLRATEDQSKQVTEKPGHGVFVATFLLLVVAEFGDKTHLAVAGLAGTADPLAVWIGGTLALSSIGLLGILAGRTILQRIPLRLLHRIGGILFLVLAALAFARAIM